MTRPRRNPSEVAALVGVVAGLAALGYVDREIAEGLGIGAPYVSAIRLRHQIPAGRRRLGTRRVATDG